MVVTGTVTVSLEATTGERVAADLGAMTCDPLLQVNKELNKIWIDFLGWGVTPNHGNVKATLSNLSQTFPHKSSRKGSRVHGIAAHGCTSGK